MEKIRHKTMGGNAMGMCGAIVDEKQRTRKWEETTCEACLKVMSSWSKTRRRKKGIYENQTKKA